MRRLLFLLLPLAACTPMPQEAPAPGLANPASVHCAKLGGMLESQEEPGGTVSYCHLPDGSVVEEWELFRASQP